MDYEKAYKEALERARKRFDANPTDGYVGYGNEILKEIFPELRESEDERIRKSIIRILQVGGYMPDEEKKKAFSYLERQKEQQPAEWSEHDELMRDAVLNTLERIGDYGTIGMQKEWLKSLRPQPKQKRHLGEKDQWCCSAAWAAVRDSGAYNGEEKQLILDFLQRCEFQPHWKPSEEQIQDLQMLLDDLNNLDNKNNVKMIKVFHWSENYKNLKGLLDDLKKFIAYEQHL